MHIYIYIYIYILGRRRSSDKNTGFEYFSLKYFFLFANLFVRREEACVFFFREGVACVLYQCSLSYSFRLNSWPLVSTKTQGAFVWDSIFFHANNRRWKPKRTISKELLTFLFVSQFCLLLFLVLAGVF